MDQIRVKPGVLAQRESHFSWLRTRLSTERTLMSVVRTAAALIGFGFTIFQFFERYNATKGVAPAENPRMPWLFALGLIGIGILALLIALVEYRRLLRYLWSEDFRDIAGVGEKPEPTMVIVAAWLLVLVGLATFIALLTRTGGR